MNRSLFALPFFLAGLLVWGAAASGEEAAKPWKENAELSAVSTNGNSRATTISAKNTFNYQWTHSMLEVVASALGSESQDRTIAEQYNASEKLTWDLIGRNYTYEKLGWDKNRFAGINHRYDASAGLGRDFFDKENKNQFILEAGAGYINEERDNAPRNDFASGRAYGKYTRALTATANFAQELEYLANFKDSNGYRVNSVSALTVAISTHFSLKASYTWNRVNQPPAGFGKDDTITAVALVANY